MTRNLLMMDQRGETIVVVNMLKCHSRSRQFLYNPCNVVSAKSGIKQLPFTRKFNRLLGWKMATRMRDIVSFFVNFYDGMQCFPPLFSMLDDRCRLRLLGQLQDLLKFFPFFQQEFQREKKQIEAEKTQVKPCSFLKLIQVFCLKFWRVLVVLIYEANL